MRDQAFSPVDEVCFVFLGDTLPLYARHSIVLAEKHSGLSVRLLGNQKIGKYVKKTTANFTPVEDFYNSDSFTKAQRNISLSHGFRGGFWLKSLERFFVLDQYLGAVGGKTVFHAELDQLLFGCDRLVRNLNSFDKRGLFFPLHGGGKAVASVFFCNSRTALDSLIQEAMTGGVFGNEMELLTRWASKNPSAFFALPTIADLKKFREEQALPPELSISPEMLGGVVDAAQLGQWVAGIDPRNVPVRTFPKNKFVDQSGPNLLTKEELGNLEFRLDNFGNSLFATGDAVGATKVFNLHLHSKIHPWLARTAGIHKLVAISNSRDSVTLPTTRRAQLTGFLCDQWDRVLANPLGAGSSLRGWVYGIFGHRPSSYPFISSDTFRHKADQVLPQRARGSERSSTGSGRQWKIFCEWSAIQNDPPVIHDDLGPATTLLIGSSEQLDPVLLERALPSKTGVRVFAQNLASASSNVEFLPLGLENAALGKRGSLHHFKARRHHRERRLFRVLWSFSTDVNPEVRIPAANDLLRSHVADRKLSVNTRTDLARLRKYHFVATPSGSGPDSHALWEALYSGCVPVALRTPLIEFYVSLGMPVWVVKDYSELEGVSEADLEEIFEEFAPKFSCAALKAGFWFSRIDAGHPHQTR